MSFVSPAESRVSREKAGLAKKVCVQNDVEFGFARLTLELYLY